MSQDISTDTILNDLHARYPVSTQGRLRVEAVNGLRYIWLGDTLLGTDATMAEEAIRRLPAISYAEAAARMGVTVGTVRSWVARGKLTPLALDGRTRLIPLAQLDALARNPPRVGNPTWRKRLCRCGPG